MIELITDEEMKEKINKECVNKMSCMNCRCQHFCSEHDCQPFEYLLFKITHEELCEMYHTMFSDVDNVMNDNTDNVNHPNHYNRNGAMECIDEMVVVFGIEAVMNFCLLNVWKYRFRASDKNGQEDLKKSDWYMHKYAELKGQMNGTDKN